MLISKQKYKKFGKFQERKWLRIIYFLPNNAFYPYHLNMSTYQNGRYTQLTNFTNQEPHISYTFSNVDFFLGQFEPYKMKIIEGYSIIRNFTTLCHKVMLTEE